MQNAYLVTSILYGATSIEAVFDNPTDAISFAQDWSLRDLIRHVKFWKEVYTEEGKYEEKECLKSAVRASYFYGVQQMKINERWEGIGRNDEPVFRWGISVDSPEYKRILMKYGM